VLGLAWTGLPVGVAPIRENEVSALRRKAKRVFEQVALLDFAFDDKFLVEPALPQREFRVSLPTAIFQQLTILPHEDEISLSQAIVTRSTR
jgi:hypothetical protein